MPRKKTEKPIDDSVEDYQHKSFYKGDTPPPWVARAIEDSLRDNPYRDMPTAALKALSLELRKAVDQLSLVERVLCARNSAW